MTSFLTIRSHLPEQSGFNLQVLCVLSSLFPYHKLMPVAVCPCRSGS